MDPLTADAPVLQSATVTLDALHTGVMWGWYVTMNMWAKSVGTGVLLVGHRSNLRLGTPIIPPATTADDAGNGRGVQ